MPNKVLKSVSKKNTEPISADNRSISNNRMVFREIKIARVRPLLRNKLYKTAMPIPILPSIQYHHICVTL